MQQSPASPLSRFVLFIICLAVAGTTVSGLHYVVIDQPQQNAVQKAPSNGCLPSAFQEGCTYYTCPTSCCMSKEEMHASYSCCRDENGEPVQCNSGNDPNLVVHFR